MNRETDPGSPVPPVPPPAPRPTTRRHRIVAGVDGSPCSVAAATWACDHAARTGATLELLTTWEWVTGYGWSAVLPDWDPPTDSRRELDELAATLHHSHPGVAIATTVVEGAAGPVLVEAADGAELLAVGSHGRGGLRRMVLGSVSLHCATHARGPVLIVPPSPRHRNG